jgi:hypothetical protein
VFEKCFVLFVTCKSIQDWIFGINLISFNTSQEKESESWHDFMLWKTENQNISKSCYWRNTVASMNSHSLRRSHGCISLKKIRGRFIVFSPEKYYFSKNAKWQQKGLLNGLPNSVLSFCLYVLDFSFFGDEKRSLIIVLAQASHHTFECLFLLTV